MLLAESKTEGKEGKEGRKERKKERKPSDSASLVHQRDNYCAQVDQQIRF